MRKSFAILAAFFLLNFSFFSYSQVIETARGSVQVGKQPAILYDNGSDLLLFCLGWDANYDGNFDPQNDEMPSIWDIFITTPSYSQPNFIFPTKMMDIEFGTTFFLYRPAFNIDKNYNMRFFYQHNNHIKIVDIRERKLIDSIPFEDKIANIFIEDDLLYLSTQYIPEGAWTAEDNYLIIFDMKTKSAVDTIPADMNIRMSKAIKDKYIYILNEGLGGVDDSFISIYNYFKNEDGTRTLYKKYSVGSFGNHFDLDYSGDNVFVVSNGFHKVTQFNIHDDSAFEYILPTNGFNGPREVKYNPHESKIRVSTYDGNVYGFELNNPTPTEIFETSAKVESMAWKGNFLFLMTNISNHNFSPADSLIAIINYISSVTDNPINKVATYPNPTSDYIIVSCDDVVANYLDYQIVSLQGEVIGRGSLHVVGNTTMINLKQYNLQNGTYFLKLTFDQKQVYRKITIQR